MKTLIHLGLVAVIFGGLSAAATILMQPKGSSGLTVAASNGEHSTSATDKSGDDTTLPDDGTGDPDSSHAHHPGETEDGTAHALEDNELNAAEPPRSSHRVPQAKPDTDAAKLSAAPIEPGGTHPEARVAVRPPYTPEGDEAGELIKMLRERSRTATETERRLAERQDAMQLIFDDLRAEQARTVKIRQRLTSELKESRQAVDVALQAVESERTAIQKNHAEARKAADDAVRAAIEERDKLRMQLEKATKSPATGDSSGDVGGSAEENANLKKLALVYDSMPAENVARIFEQLVKNKQTPAVVSLMNSMKDRQAAKVLGLIAETNAELAADLTDRLKRLKTSTARPVAE